MVSSMSQLEAMREAVALTPENLALRTLYADHCLQEGAWEEARLAFEELLAREPAHQTAPLGMARALQHLGRLSEAIVRMEAYLAGENADREGWILLAELLRAEGDDLAADRALLQAGGLTGEPAGGATDGLDWHPAPATGEEVGRRPRVHPVQHEPLRKLKLEDVSGLDAVKQVVRAKIIRPFELPALHAAYGQQAGGGLLFYGPPGCGKTMLARSVAGEIDAHFLSVGLHEILDMWLGSSERRLHRLFEMARARKPAVLFFDEIDALAASRTDLKRAAGRSLINQFLAELDGVDADNDGLLVIGATNAPWHLDPAFKRPGRFDRMLFVPPPDLAGREAILRRLARDRPVDPLDFGLLAQKTARFSGADLAAAFDRATEEALFEANKRGRLIHLTTRRLLAAIRKVKPTPPPWFEEAERHARYANESGFYDDILDYLQQR